MNPYQVTKDFEKALCEYTGAPYAVAVNSGTMAILLALKWHAESILPVALSVTVPRKTYVSVPCAVLTSGLMIEWTDKPWKGEYQFSPLPVWDSACRFTSGMYRAGQFQCVSFATNKILGIEQGGAILHDSPEADTWFRKMRFDGRTEGVSVHDDTFDVIGYHCIMLPSIAAQLTLKLFHTKKNNEDLSFNYPDLSRHPAFMGHMA